jgi:hypothetical protein
MHWAVIYAAASGRRSVVELLLRRDPDLRTTDPVFGSTAAGMARYDGHDDLAALIDSATCSRRGRRA